MNITELQHRKLTAAAQKILVRRELAEEAVQQAVLKALSSNTVPHNLMAYLSRIVYHESINITRRDEFKHTYYGELDYDNL